ncbi:hypothetical protein HYX00_01760 [Candidatus Woesearchaeota archaeon]|nr:hypothetical protein [Candidatus Woesearchaeota archaeon]
MFRKIYGIAAGILLLIQMLLFTFIWGNPFLVFSSELRIIGLLSITSEVIIAVSGFIENKILRISLTVCGAILWFIITFIGFVGNPAAIF